MITCSKIAAVATQSIPGPYFTTIVGPTIHSPPPIAPASRIAPGPIVLNRLTTENGSGSGRSAVRHGARQPCVGVSRCSLRGKSFNVETRVVYARISDTTRPDTSVSRKSRPA
jgi:hypothetical protein